MITALNLFTYTYEILINFVAHFLIFSGCFYVAIHNRKLAQWHIAPLWYTGVFSLLTCFTIVCQWAIGPEFPLSYYNLGKLAETAVNVCLATLSAIMLFGTARTDIKASKKRARVPE